MPRLMSCVLVAALFGSGCAYVGQTTFEKKRDSLDHDSDGALYGGPGKDCNDFSKLEAPGKDEIPYDGFDNDCAEGDLVDADGDGYPGILRADYEKAFPDAEWPASVVDGPLDCADDPKVYANAKDIHPGQNGDNPYDGIDQDCAHDNDYDADGDGYVPDEYMADFQAYVETWGYQDLVAQVQFGDCNDFRPEANPSVSPLDDIWYDGDDDDCAGNNDFDADGDGFMWDQAANAQDYTNFLNTYHPDGPPWVEAWDDCLDQARSMSVSPDPAQVYPGNPVDVPYDGIDSDCACDNDFDGDGDTAMPDSAATAFADYLSDWGCVIDELYGDCDDADPITFPGALELFGDAADSDCDLDPDGTPFGFGTQTQNWDNPRSPVVLRTTDAYIIVDTSEWVDLAGLVKPWLGTATVFDPSAGYIAAPTGTIVQWSGVAAPLPYGVAVDAVAAGADFFGATSYYFGGASGYVSVKEMAWNGALGTYVANSNEWGTIPAEYVATGVDIVADVNDHPWVVACGPQQVQVLRGDRTSGTTGVTAAIGPDFATPSGIPSGVCFWESQPDGSGFPLDQGTGQVVVCDPGVDCVTYEFDATPAGLSVSPTQNWTGRQLDYGQFKDGWILLIDSTSTGAILEGPFGTIPVLNLWNVTDVDAIWRDTDGNGVDDMLYAAAIGEPIPDDGMGPRVVVSYGTIGGAMTEKVFAYNHPSPTMVPTGVGIHADDDRLVIAVSGIDDNYDPYTSPLCGVATAGPYCVTDSLGWIFLGWP